MRIPELEREEVNAVCLRSSVWILTWVYDHMCMIPRVFDDQMDLPRLRPPFAELVSYPKVALRRWRFPLGQRKRCDYQARRGGCHLGDCKIALVHALDIRYSVEWKPLCLGRFLSKGTVDLQLQASVYDILPLCGKVPESGAWSVP